jgi:microcystin-dependent protein
MKKIAALFIGFVVAFSALGTHFVARAGVTCSLPFQLQNSTTADATQVMANYNALVTCLANAAAAGANNDITSLAALSTPLTTAQGGTPVYVGGTSTGGSGNAHVLATVSPSNFSLAAGKQVTFVAGLGNNTAATLNVSGTGTINIFRQTQLGISALVGGEIVAGRPVTVIYDGTEFVLISAGPYMVGEIRDFSGPAAPAGWAIIDGSCQVRATFADLFSVIGTTYDPTGSTCDVAHFALPDGRGRLLAGKDTTLSRITVAQTGCNGNILGGAGCGQQAWAIGIANLPNYGLTVTDPGHSHSVQTVFATNGASGSAVSVFTGAGTQTGTSTTGITVSSGGSGTLQPTLPPVQIVNKIIKL